MSIFKNLKKYNEIGKTNFRNNFVYIWDSLFGKAFFIGIIIFIFSHLWSTIFKQSGVSVISGFTLPMMVWYLVLTESILVSLSGVIRDVSSEIKSGDVANYLTKPYNYIFYKYAISIGKGAFNFFLFFLVGGIMAYLTVGGISVEWYTIPFILLVVFLAITLSYFIIINIGLAAFWIEETNGLAFIYNKFVFVIGGMLVPLEILPLWLAKIGLLLPFSYIAYHPAKLFVMFDFTYFFNIFIIQLAWIVVFIIISLFIYSIVSKKVSINGG